MKTSKLLQIIGLTISMSSAIAQPITVAGTRNSGHTGDGGLATSANIQATSSAVTDASGNLYLLGGTYIRKVDPSGIITTFAGSGTNTAVFGDGGPATSAGLSTWWTGICKFDPSGNLIFIDNGGGCIRKITPAGIISTIAGTGTSTYTGDGGPATLAGINANDLAIDALGNIYILQFSENVVRKINTSGIITTEAGNGSGGFSGDGGLATSAMLNGPISIAVDNTGNLFIAEAYYRIRKVNTSGIISTYAGTGVSGYSGDGGLATSSKLFIPSMIYNYAGGKIAMNNTNELCFFSNSTTGTNNIRKINSAGIISTIVDSTMFTPVTGSPIFMHFDSANNLYFNTGDQTPTGDGSSDGYGENTPYSVTYKLPASSITGIEALDVNDKLVKVYPVPSNGAFTIETEFTNNASLEVIDIKGQVVYSQKISVEKTNVDISFLASGNYILNITGNGVTVKKNIIINK